MGRMKWNRAALEEMEASLVKGGMKRLEAAADLIVEDAKRILKSKIAASSAEPVTRPSKEGDPIWMERTPGALVETIRWVRKRGDTRNIWIMAGNFKTWWAVQTEYGRGGWKGGAKPFMRPAMKNAPLMIKSVLESGSGETK